MTQSTSPEIRSPTDAPKESALAAFAVAALRAAEVAAQTARKRSRGAKGSLMMAAASTGAARRDGGTELSSTCRSRIRSSNTVRCASREMHRLVVIEGTSNELW
eukprot:scaffold147527_cov34-Tisochrysis_lutea.AAC.3